MTSTTNCGGGCSRRRIARVRAPTPLPSPARWPPSRRVAASAACACWVASASPVSWWVAHLGSRRYGRPPTLRPTPGGRCRRGAASVAVRLPGRCTHRLGARRRPAVRHRPHRRRRLARRPARRGRHGELAAGRRPAHRRRPRPCRAHLHGDDRDEHGAGSHLYLDGRHHDVVHHHDRSRNEHHHGHHGAGHRATDRTPDGAAHCSPHHCGTRQPAADGAGQQQPVRDLRHVVAGVRERSGPHRIRQPTTWASPRSPAPGPASAAARRRSPRALATRGRPPSARSAGSGPTTTNSSRSPSPPATLRGTPRPPWCRCGSTGRACCEPPVRHSHARRRGCLAGLVGHRHRRAHAPSAAPTIRQPRRRLRRWTGARRCCSTPPTPPSPSMHRRRRATTT
jgi:hypothetical protein